MLRLEKLRYEMLLRVRDFGNKHQSLLPETSAAGHAFTTVVAALTVVEEHSADRLVTAHAGKKAKAMARQDLVARMAAIARCARRAERLGPKVPTVLRMPRTRSDISLIDAARAFILDGAAVSHQWVPLGLPDTSLADLQQSVAQLQRAIGDRREGRSGQTASRVGLRDALKRGCDAVSDLDVIVSNMADLDPIVLAVWRESRRINPKSGVDVAKLTAPTTTEDSSASPPEADVVTPAAPAASTSLVAIADTLRKVS